MRANDFAAFQRAREFYEAGDFERAVQAFEALTSGDVPQTHNLPLRLESRKYLAASYLFLGQREAAAEQFEHLLEEDPTYLLDPLAFPEEVLAMFEQVRKRLAAEQQTQRATREQAERQAREREAQRLLEERQRLQLLVDLASTEHMEQRRSRWVAMLPFGAGQFQNGHDGLGVGMAVSQGLLLATHIGTYVAHENLRGVRPAESDLQRARLTESALRLGNQVSLGLFVAVVMVGIVDAQLRFKSRHVIRRKRELPPELDPFLQQQLGSSEPGLWSWHF